MIDIRPFQLELLPQLKAIFLENTPEYFAPEEWTDLHQYLEEHSASYFVLMQKDELIGAGGYRLLDESSAQFHWNFLALAHQKKRLGSRLLEFCIKEVQQIEGIETLEVRTSQHAEGFYHKFGFEVIRREENYWAQDLHLVQMSLSF